MTLKLVALSEDDAQEQAVHWVARWRSGQMTEAEFEAIEAWFNLEPGNRQVFDDIVTLWEGIEPARRDPAVMALREKARRWARRISLTRFARRAAVVLLVVAVGFGVARFATGAFGTAPDLYATRLGQTSAIRLADGTNVTLDTNSELKVWMRRRGERRVELVRGRAYFDVGKDPSRPFIVRTGQGSVTAVGTAFDVRKEAHGLKVTLVEGRVRIKPQVGGAKSQPVEMAAGYQYVGGAGSWHITRGAPSFEVSWIKGDLVFDDEPLATIVEEMNRYIQRKIVIGDAAVGQRRLSAVLKIGDTETFLSSVQMLGMAQVQTTRGETVLLVASK